MGNRCCGRRKENREMFAEEGSGAEPRPAAFAGSSSPSPIAPIAGKENSLERQAKRQANP